VAQSREFNRVRRWLAVLAVAAFVLIVGPARADEVKKWRDADGNLHYSITGSEAGSEEEGPVVQGRPVSREETFSVDVSLRRKEIETKLVAATRDLDKTRSEIATTEARKFSAWVPNLTGNAAAAQSSIDAQRDAFLAASQFEEEKAEQLRRLRRHERADLKEIVALWKEFAALDAVVTGRYGTAPDWWRKRLSCGDCPALAEAERALHGPKAQPSPAAGEKGSEADDQDWGEDEDWQ